MLMGFARAAVAAVAFALGSTAASASTITSYINLAGGGGYNSSYTFTDGPLSLTTTGHLLNSNGSIGAQKTIGQWSGGLGVKSGLFDQHYVDSNGADEVIKFVFNMAVKIERVWFTYVDRNDDFSFSVVAGSAVQQYFPNIDIVGLGTASYEFVGTHVSNVFGIGAAGFGDAFKVKAIKVSYDVAPVPLPAAGWLLLVGLGGLALVGRRKAS